MMPMVKPRAVLTRRSVPVYSTGHCSLKITERCTMKLTVVATPWAMTKAMTWTGKRLSPCAVNRVNSTLNRPTCSAKVTAYKHHDRKETARRGRRSKRPAPVDQIRRRRAGDEGDGLGRRVPEPERHQDHQQSEVHDRRETAGNDEPAKLSRQRQRALSLIDRQLNRLRKLVRVLSHRLLSCQLGQFGVRRRLNASMPSSRSGEEATSCHA